MPVRYIELPFALGESILLNLAMCACVQVDAAPLTDQRLRHNLLKSKYARAMRNTQWKEALVEEGVMQSAAEEALWRRLMGSTLPSVATLPAAEIIRIRKRLASQLEDFRVELAKVAAEIEETPPSRSPMAGQG